MFAPREGHIHGQEKYAFKWGGGEKYDPVDVGKFQPQGRAFPRNWREGKGGEGCSLLMDISLPRYTKACAPRGV